MSQATEAFWLLSDPFEPRPDIRFLVPSRPIRAALAALQQMLQTQEAQWTLLVGPPGVGKGVLIQLFAEAWTGAQPIVVIPDASVPYGELSGQIREQLDPSSPDSEPIIFLEGAEALSPEVISALERDEEEMGPSARFVVVLDQASQSPVPDWVKRRGAGVIPLEPMDAKETQLYVERRVRLAAGGERDLFEESAIRELHRRADGLPEAINQLARRALDRAATQGEPWVTTDAVTAAARDLGLMTLPVVSALDLDTPVELAADGPTPPTADGESALGPEPDPEHSKRPEEPSPTEVSNVLEAPEEWQTDVILEEERIPAGLPAPLIVFAAWVIGLMMGAIVTFYFLGSWESLGARRASHFPVIARALNEGEINPTERPRQNGGVEPAAPSAHRPSPSWARSSLQPES